MKGDLLLVIKWWFYIFAIGIIFFPVTEKLFRKFFDRGYMFSKTLGIALSSYIVWLLSSLRIAVFSRITIFMVLAVFIILIYMVLKGYKSLYLFIKGKAFVFIAEEILFLAGLIFWSYIRGIQPNIYGLEKFMDLGFVNAILRAKYMPPVDMWFAGSNINYYYFGHYVCAFLTRLSSMDSAVTYNLALAAIFSFTFSLTFSLAGNAVYILGKQGTKKVIAAGLISACLLTFGGNLHTIIYAYIMPAAQKAGIYKGQVQQYYYPEATRYIGYNPETNDKTIHEFPIYSFVVSDLHGHVSDIPFVLTFLAVILIYTAEKKNSKRKKLLIPFLLSIMYMTNTWDFIIYLTVAFFAGFYVNVRDSGFNKKSVSNSLLFTLKNFIVMEVLCLPFILKFKNIIGGVGFVYARTPLYQLLVLWGYQLLLSVCFVVFLIRFREGLISIQPEKRNENLLRSFRKSDMFTLILLISAIGLVILPEIVYIVDIYGITYHRANTMFKLTYQSFIMFGIASGYIVVRIVSCMKRQIPRILAAGAFTIILLCPMLYPYQAIKGYYGSIKPSNYKGLYGLQFLENKYPDDYKAVMWLNENVSGQAVVLEANGDSYTDYNRISMATGLPTIQGWYVHEWLWRGSAEIPQARADEVALIYESEDIDHTKILLDKYNVRYIVVGRLERNKFKNLNYEKLLKLGNVVFDMPETKIIKVEQ